MSIIYLDCPEENLYLTINKDMIISININDKTLVIQCRDSIVHRLDFGTLKQAVEHYNILKQRL